MSKVGSSGHHGTGTFDAADGDRPQAAPRQSRFDDRPKGMGSRDAGLGQRSGTGSQASAGHREDARAEAFGRSLDGAMSQHKPSADAKARDRQAEDRAPDAEVSLLLAGLSSQPVALTAAAPRDAKTAKGERHAHEAVGGRQTGLKGLWAHEPEVGRAQPTAAAAATSGSTPSDRHRAEPDKPKRVLHLMAEADPALAAQAAAPSHRAGPASGHAEGATPGTAAPAPSAATAERVDRIADRVAEAIRSEESVAPGQAVSLEIPLDAAGSGAQHLTVSLSATGVDVTLARDAGAASADLLGAAQGLAERLQRRFPNRTVRVYDAVRPSVMAFGQVASAARVSPLSDSDDL